MLLLFVQLLQDLQQLSITFFKKLYMQHHCMSCSSNISATLLHSRNKLIFGLGSEDSQCLESPHCFEKAANSQDLDWTIFFDIYTSQTLYFTSSWILTPPTNLDPTQVLEAFTAVLQTLSLVFFLVTCSFQKYILKLACSCRFWLDT